MWRMEWKNTFCKSFYDVYHRIGAILGKLRIIDRNCILLSISRLPDCRGCSLAHCSPRHTKRPNPLAPERNYVGTNVKQQGFNKITRSRSITATGISGSKTRQILLCPSYIGMRNRVTCSCCQHCPLFFHQCRDYRYALHWRDPIIPSLKWGW